MRFLFRSVTVPAFLIALFLLAPAALVGGLFLWAAVGDVPFINVQFFPEDGFSVSAPSPTAEDADDLGEPPVLLLNPLPSPHSAIEQPPELRGKDLPHGFTVQLWAEGLQRSTAMAFAPDGTLYVAEQWTGEIRLVRNGIVLEEPRIKIAQTEELQGTDPDRAGERGLVGMTLHPQFAENGLIFAYATLGNSPTGGVGSNTIFRVRMDGDTVVDIFKVLELLEASLGVSHNGGAMAFGPDGALYLGIGDGAASPDADNPAQNPDDPRGKILRITLDDEGNVTDWEVYAMGFRNVFGLAFHPLTTELLASDNGPVGNDELNIVRQGQNYGWPLVLGKAADPNFQDPAIVWNPSIVPTGMTFYQGGRLPFLANDLLMCQFNPNWTLHWIRITLRGQAGFDKELAANTCVTAVTIGPDGLVYMTDYNLGGASVGGRIHRIAPIP